MWELPHRVSLDAISTDSDFSGLTVVEVAHRALAGSGVAWAVLTNGRQVRLLGKQTAHKPRCFLEIDLDATLDRVGSAEALMAFRYWLGLFSGSSLLDRDGDGHSRLNRVLIGSDRHGQEIGDELKQNVYRALEELGEGFLSYLRKHEAEREEWRQQYAPDCPKSRFLHAEELLNVIYQESLGLMYRLLFLFYAESRNLLPMEDEMYRETYSLEALRDEIISVQDDPDPKRFFGKGTHSLWGRLKELFTFVNTGWSNIVPAYNGGLFDPEQHEFLERFQLDDYHLARAIDLLSRTRPRRGQVRGEGRKKVTYRDLDVRHLGTIYEGLLEYSAQIAPEDQVVLRRGSGKGAYEEYAAVSSLSASEAAQLRDWQSATAEDPEAPRLPRDCKVTGFKPTGSFFLVYGGSGSKRKSSGSYYTPDYVVQYIAETTLGYLLTAKKELARTPLTSADILLIRVLDPAMGSGHFLVAATEILAALTAKPLSAKGKMRPAR